MIQSIFLFVHKGQCEGLAEFNSTMHDHYVRQIQKKLSKFLPMTRTNALRKYITYFIKETMRCLLKVGKCLKTCY